MDFVKIKQPMRSLFSFAASLALAFSAGAALTAEALAADAAVKADYALKEVAGNLVSPMALRSIPDGSGNKVVADQVGLIYVLSKEGQLLEKPYLDARDRLCKLNAGFDERGLLDVVFHPKFSQNKKFYVFYTAPKRDSAPADWDHTSRVSEFKAADGLEADPASERVIYEHDHPWFNHNGGRIEFGPDGYLYIGIGDGGNGNDEGRGHNPAIGNGQDLTVTMGKILRIDVDKGNPYGIPSDNPFADGKKGRPEIFAYGFRNPWGLSFDRGGSRDLFAADVGQDRWEEINLVVKGGNYGWRILENTECFNPKKSVEPLSDCPKTGANGEPLLEPVVAYKHMKGFARDPEAKGTSVTGGYVYRGKQLPNLQGRYVFADWTKNWVKADGVLFAATRPATGDAKRWAMETLKVAPLAGDSLGVYIIALAEDADGELYILSNTTNGMNGRNGKVHKIVASP